MELYNHEIKQQIFFNWIFYEFSHHLNLEYSKCAANCMSITNF